MKILFQAFWSFAKIGLFTLGGGYAMIPLVEKEVVTNKKWLSEEDFIDSLALAQSAPGILAVNMAIFVGHKLRGLLGAFVAALGAVLPSFLIILAIAIFFSDFRENEYVDKFFKGARPAVVALIAVPVLNMIKKLKLSWRNAWLPVVAVGLIYFLGISAVFVIMGGVILGIFYHIFSIKKRKK